MKSFTGRAYLGWFNERLSLNQLHALVLCYSGRIPATTDLTPDHLRRTGRYRTILLPFLRGTRCIKFIEVLRIRRDRLLRSERSTPSFTQLWRPKQWLLLSGVTYRFEYFERQKYRPRTFNRRGNVIRVVTAPHPTGLSVGTAYSLILMRHSNDKRDD